MSPKIYINLAAKDLEKSTSFFKKLGCKIEPRYTDNSASCLMFSENIYIMLIEESVFAECTKKKVADSLNTTEVITCLSAVSRENVNELLDKALGAGATEAMKPIEGKNSNGRSFYDLDGHMWEIMWVGEKLKVENNNI